MPIFTPMNGAFSSSNRGSCGGNGRRKSRFMTRTGCRLTKSVGIKFFPLGLVLIWLVASPLIVLAAGKVNINTAGAGELDNVPEVGAARSEEHTSELQS